MKLRDVPPLALIILIVALFVGTCIRLGDALLTAVLVSQ
jgi:hypothetical protein